MGNRNRKVNALKAAKKRRERRPVPQYVAPGTLKANHSLQRRMSRDHLDVLQNIEFALVTAYRDTDDVDDHVCEAVLRAAFLGTEPADARIKWVLDVLQTLRQQRPDVSDELWADGLRVVHTSLRNHSQCMPGETDYLDFVAAYVS